jgi:hypothetical protein
MTPGKMPLAFAGVGCEVHRSGLEKGPGVDFAAASVRQVSDGTLPSTTFVKTKALPATIV